MSDSFQLTRNKLQAQFFNAGIFSAANIFFFESIGSSMDVAAELAKTRSSEKELAAMLRNALLNQTYSRTHPTDIVIAFEQTKGRGQKGRSWFSVPGEGGYLTFCFYSDRQALKIAGFSLVLGIAVVRALAPRQLTLALKWPNDVLALRQPGGELRKLAGILVEASSSGAEVQSVLAGIGINLTHSSFPEDVPGVSLLQLSSSRLDYAELVATLSKTVLEVAEEYFTKGFIAFKEEWLQFALLEGVQVRRDISRVDSEAAFELGRVTGVAEDGGLLALFPDKRRPEVVYSGEVELTR